MTDQLSKVEQRQARVSVPLDAQYSQNIMKVATLTVYFLEIYHTHDTMLRLKRAKKNLTWRREGFVHLTPMQIFNNKSCKYVCPSKGLVTKSLALSSYIFGAETVSVF